MITGFFADRKPAVGFLRSYPAVFVEAERDRRIRAFRQRASSSFLTGPFIQIRARENPSKNRS